MRGCQKDAGGTLSIQSSLSKRFTEIDGALWCETILLIQRCRSVDILITKRSYSHFPPAPTFLHRKMGSPQPAFSFRHTTGAGKAEPGVMGVQIHNQICQSARGMTPFANGRIELVASTTCPPKLTSVSTTGG